jgi:hypothetical protein
VDAAALEDALVVAGGRSGGASVEAGAGAGAAGGAPATAAGPLSSLAADIDRAALVAALHGEVITLALRSGSTRATTAVARTIAAADGLVDGAALAALTRAAQRAAADATPPPELFPAASSSFSHFAT